MRGLHNLFSAGLKTLFVLWAGVVVAQDTLTSAWSSYVGGDWDTDGVYAVATDSATNSFIGGFLGQGDIRNSAGITSLTPYQGGDDGFVAKINGSGALVWYLCFGNESDEGEDDCIRGLAAHASGTVYAVGFLNRTDLNDTGTDATVFSINSSSGLLNWTVPVGNPNGINGFNAVATDSNGYVYAVGYTTSTNLSGTVPGYQVNGTTYGTQLKGSTDACVVKLSPSGSIVWTHYLGGTNADAATACSVTPDGFIYVGGETRSPGWASLPSSTPGPDNPDAFLVKLTTNGTHVWSAFLGGSGADAVTALVKDPASSVLFLGGNTDSPDFLSSATRLNTRGGSTDGFVVKLTEAGAAFQTNWCRFFGGSSTDCVASLTLKPAGNVVAGGATTSGSWLTQTPDSTFGGIQDGFISQLASDGSVVWSSYVGGTRSDVVRALASAPNALLAVGSTFSTNPPPYWVHDGFWTEWCKDPNWNIPPIPDYNADLSYGFVGKWTSEPGLPPTLTPEEPADLSVQEGQTAVFQVAATGTGTLSYRWLRNGVPADGFTSNAYVIAAVALTNNQDTYSCVVSNLYGTATSRAARLTVISNATLTVTLSPAQATAQGAAWRVNSGATWFTSGASTQLAEGTYTVSFTNLLGWSAPAALSSVHLSAGETLSTSGVYTAVLPSAERSISGTNVAVTVRAPAGVSTWTLVETLSAGLTPTNITGSGVWNSAAHTLTFTGTEATTNTLSYLVICAASGVYSVSGTVTPQPANVPAAVTGDNRIIKANLVRTINGTSVTIIMYQPTVNKSWYVNEYLPTNLAPINITGPVGEWIPEDTMIYWGTYGKGTTLTYEVTGPPGTYTLDGIGNIANVPEPIFGDTVLTIPGAAVPSPDILSLVPVAATNAFALTFISVANQTYMIRTNATVSATNLWADSFSVTGEAGTTVRPVPMSGPRLFYRVRAVQ
jgi:hypothetical protein